MAKAPTSEQTAQGCRPTSACSLACYSYQLRSVHKHVICRHKWCAGRLATQSAL